ncbi:hypothetical protein QFZ75_001126 [Streptomyces sp. V3I8]|uniref:hypothetical protein n=1 Tax=Streptomyces sp. V3I8 TaxID=3042279 RepID=UPI00278A344D|nr:hypothetical protein [Streptomyces sp. V3I8]MDQ1034710.1 hypothetical protein [Streptomyces sp. V3I8]
MPGADVGVRPSWNHCAESRSDPSTAAGRESHPKAGSPPACDRLPPITYSTPYDGSLPADADGTATTRVPVTTFRRLHACSGLSHGIPVIDHGLQIVGVKRER